MRVSIPVAATLILLAGCGGDKPATTAATPAATTAGVDRVVDIGGRGLYLRCEGEGTPTVIMEGGDGDTSDSYAFAFDEVAARTRACVYDRANLGRSDPAPGPRQLADLVGDLDRLIRAARLPGPFVLVGTSGGGYITAAYAVEHSSDIAGMVFVETPSPFRDPPRPIVAETDPDSPDNPEQRDYLQVEKDAWAARRRIGDIPVTVISNRYSEAEIAAAEFGSEARAMRTNVTDQRGWLELSPRAEQIVVRTGHAVEEVRPDFVIGRILDVVRDAATS